MPIRMVSELIDTPMKRTPMVIEQGVLPHAGAWLIYGAPDVGKTMMTMHLAKCLANGEPWFGYSTIKCAVILRQVEIPEPMLKDRLTDYEKGIGGRMLSGFNQVAESSEPFKLDTPYGLQSVISEVEWVRDQLPMMPIVMIFDPLYKITSGHLSDQYDATKLSDNLDVLRRNFGVSIVLLHHNHKTRRADDGSVINEGQDAVSGSGFLQAWPDTILRMWRVDIPDSPNWGNKMVWEKHRFAKHNLPAFQTMWNVSNLKPELYYGKQYSTDELTIKNLEGKSEQSIESIVSMLDGMGGMLDDSRMVD